MEDLIGKEVIVIDGPGQGELTPGSKGRIIAERRTQFGTYWEVEWIEGNNAGSTESYTKHTVKHISDRRGIGVYYL